MKRDKAVTSDDDARLVLVCLHIKTFGSKHMVTDGIVENDSDMQPKKVHGDSWTRSEVLFGFSSLMAILIMPRIK